jgi:hypothetical protein
MWMIDGIGQGKLNGWIGSVKKSRRTLEFCSQEVDTFLRPLLLNSYRSFNVLHKRWPMFADYAEVVGEEG